MKYLALYRKYRPDTFDKVIGQDHIIKILSAQVKTKSIGHAYLFCGSRGTGKTSVAKIFAKAINCENPDKFWSPCYSCEVCRNLNKNNMDILEIDAASNNKVEDIREIIDNSQYPPVNGKYKVYIIDEVHMLTTQAFNALLKTLEEPPLHAVFILATTENYKLPATILSRCMRFDFKLVPTVKIAELLKSVFNDIGKSFEDDAITEIARAGEGSVRDALSIADTCLSYSQDSLKHNDVLELLAASDRGNVAFIGDSILKSDTASVLLGIEKLASAGKSIAVLNKDLITFLRDISVLKSCPNEKDILIYPQEILQNYIKNVDKYSINKILRCIEILSSIETELKYSLHPRIIFEAATLKCAVSENDSGINSFENRITDLENKIKQLQNKLSNGNFISENVNISNENKPCVDKNIQNVNTQTESDITEPIPEYIPPIDNDIPCFDENIQNDNTIKKDISQQKNENTNVEINEKNSNDNELKNDTAEIVWGGVIRTLRQSGAGLLYTMCSDLKAKINGNDFIIIADNDMTIKILNKPQNLQKLKSIINKDKEYTVIIKEKSKITNNNDDDIEKLKELSDGNLIIK